MQFGQARNTRPGRLRRRVARTRGLALRDADGRARLDLLLAGPRSRIDPIETCPAASANRCRLGQHNVCLIDGI
jgi:hypothetical protein